MLQDPKAPSRCRTFLLPESPASESHFPIHTRTAEAIFDMIQNEEGGRAIALTGEFGSGKSTICNILAERPESKAMIFDAWAHSGDVLRRTFLSQLVTFLLNRGLLTEKLATSYLANLSTPSAEISIRPGKLSSYGKAYALSLLLVPIGAALYQAGVAVAVVPDTSFLSKSLSPSALQILGLFLALAPVGLLVFLTTYHFLLTRNFQRSIIASTGIFDPTQYEIRRVEPTPLSSHDFQALFVDILQTSTPAKSDRILIVFDNLDRLPPHLAESAWATLSVFSDAFIRNPGSSWKKPLWFLIPLHRGRSRSQLSEEQRALFEKLITVEFHIPLLALASWQDYMLAQLAHALPDHQESEKHLVVSLYSAYLKNQSPTPRAIKQFVNNLGALHRLYCGIILLHHCAAFLLDESGEFHADKLVETLRSINNSSKRVLLMEGKGEVLDNYAQLLYGLSKEESRHMLFREPITQALFEGHVDELKTLAEHHGFSTVFREILSEPSDMMVSTKLNRAVICLSNLQDEHLLERWHVAAVASEFAEFTFARMSYPLSSEEFLPSLKAALSVSSSEELRRRVSAKLVDELSRSDINTFLPRFEQIWKVLKAASSSTLRLPTAYLSLEKAFFLSSEIHESMEVMEFLKFFIKPDEITTYFNQREGDLSSLDTLLVRLENFDWATVYMSVLDRLIRKAELQRWEDVSCGLEALIWMEFRGLVRSRCFEVVSNIRDMEYPRLLVFSAILANKYFSAPEECEIWIRCLSQLERENVLAQAWNPQHQSGTTSRLSSINLEALSKVSSDLNKENRVIAPLVEEFLTKPPPDSSEGG